MNDEISDRNARLGARRRLLRGGFAAPAVLTLYSGSVLAQASSQCARLMANNNAQLLIEDITNHADIYIRYQLSALKKQDADPVYYIQVSRGSSQWRTFDLNNLVAIGDPVAAPSELGSTFGLVDKHVVVRIGCDGSVLGFGVKGEGFIASESALTSLII